MVNKILDNLIKTIKKNKKKNPRISYTAKLYKSGLKGCKKKFLEEVKELLNSTSRSKKDIIYESADVIYHFLVLLERMDISFKETTKELKKRSKLSGILEKKKRNLKKKDGFAR